ncbi:Nucleolar and coiled-body phosphoprotein 1 [Heracleum sosnowskyi]|uniref:Nucleolar and coiled-body phosphoprotein 1 n=1 Tax=Heracleum sosnowskyi TaxID=360622 RepID=A0AAD8JAB1_9APIA|nr:Nucleolar and coiled-body phosphoprotein 1 [Heracleum sosnowskyi]
MLKATNNVKSNPNPAHLFAFKPRQVVLAEHHRTKTLTMSKSKTKGLTQEQKTCLLHSVIKYLENNALSKTLKRILSEAQIEGEEWKSVSVDLEDLFRKYSDMCNHDETTINNQELQTEENTKDNLGNGAVLNEVAKKKKKKRSESEKDTVADQLDTVEKEVIKSSKNSEELSEDNVLIESAKVKGKKKDKKRFDDSNKSEKVQSLADTAVVEDNKMTDKIKDKKKKKSRSDNVDQEDKDLMKVVVEDQSKDMSTAACDVDKEKKSSKKRKRFVSDENEIQSDNKEAGEESKPKKVKGSEKLKKKDKSAIVGGKEESEKENTEVANIDSTKASKKVPDEHENEDLENTDKVLLDHSNGDLEKSGYKSSNQKSTKKQRIGSAEPKTVNAFQRVKIDEVEFADEKLQDNSYWAKSGAEIGYGAKAQEVLGQVRGRDFRHEKTKKKRGSYRGGMIDLQSHSVKFNYSEED